MSALNSVWISLFQQTRDRSEYRPSIRTDRITALSCDGDRQQCVRTHMWIARRWIDKTNKLAKNKFISFHFSILFAPLKIQIRSSGNDHTSPSIASFTILHFFVVVSILLFYFVWNQAEMQRPTNKLHFDLIYLILFIRSTGVSDGRHHGPVRTKSHVISFTYQNWIVSILCASNRKWISAKTESETY